MMKKGKVKRGFLQVFLILFAVIQIYPLIWLIFFSLKSNNEIFGGNIAGDRKSVV